MLVYTYYLYSKRILVSLWPFVNIIFHRNECQFFFLFRFPFFASPLGLPFNEYKIINESISRWFARADVMALDNMALLILLVEIESNVMS